MWLYLVFKALIYHMALGTAARALFISPPRPLLALFFYCLFILKWSIRLLFAFFFSWGCLQLGCLSNMMLNWMCFDNASANFCFTSFFLLATLPREDINSDAFFRKNTGRERREVKQRQQFNLPFSSWGNFSFRTLGLERSANEKLFLPFSLCSALCSLSLQASWR